ncbi:MAG: NFACT family protein [Christensenellales bacterium]
MALDGLTLGFLARELERLLLGGRIDKVAQPEKDRVLISVRAGGTNHRLLVNASPTGTRLHLTAHSYESPLEAPMFCMLMRKHLVGGRIQAITQMGGDRLIRLDITAGDELGEIRQKQLYFEAMGRHTNLSLVQDGHIIDSLRHVTDEMSRVRRMLPGAIFELPPGQDRLDPAQAGGETLLARLQLQGGPADKALSAILSGLGGRSAQELLLRLCGQAQPHLGDLDLPLLAQRLAMLLQALPGMAAPRLLMDPEGLPQDALPFPFLSLPSALQQEAPSLSEALDTLHFERDRHERLAQRTSALRRTLKSAGERVQRKLSLQEEELQSAAQMERFRVAGELLTAYGHLVPKGAAEAELPNYYDERPLLVSLDPALSPAANAQKYFKKYRKANVARRTAAQQKENSLQELRLIEEALYALEDAKTPQDIDEIKEPLREAGLIKREPQAKQRRKDKESLPLAFLSPQGMTILVGRNSLQNERLLKLAQGTDLWLHAKDSPGSHVIVRSEGKPVNDQGLLCAARLAAFYSKGRGQDVAVDHTLRKYVKKPGGSPAGFVIYTEQKTLLISVSEKEIGSIPAACP